MTDLELTKLCAEAMGYDIHESIARSEGITLKHYFPDGSQHYDPLHDDAQAIALVKKFRLSIDTIEIGAWEVWNDEDCKKHSMDVYSYAWADDLNRAIVECVAKMRAAK